MYMYNIYFVFLIRITHWSYSDFVFADRFWNNSSSLFLQTGSFRCWQWCQSCFCHVMSKVLVRTPTINHALQPVALQLPQGGGPPYSGQAGQCGAWSLYSWPHHLPTGHSQSQTSGKLFLLMIWSYYISNLTLLLICL